MKLTAQTQHQVSPSVSQSHQYFPQTHRSPAWLSGAGVSAATKYAAPATRPTAPFALAARCEMKRVHLESLDIRCAECNAWRPCKFYLSNTHTRRVGLPCLLVCLFVFYICFTASEHATQMPDFMKPGNQCALKQNESGQRWACFSERVPIFHTYTHGPPPWENSAGQGAA